MPRGIMETIGLAGAVVLAAHAALLGAELLFEGSILAGAGFLVLGVLMVLVSHSLTTPDDLIGRAIGRAVGWIVKTDE